MEVTKIEEKGLDPSISQLPDGYQRMIRPIAGGGGSV
jgi:hypothetical protein